jgi:hypothetical protein
VFHQLNDVAADTATATIEDLLLRVDGEPIGPAAFWTRTDKFCETLVRKLDTAPINLAFDRRSAGAFYPIFELSVALHQRTTWHTAPSSKSGGSGWPFAISTVTECSMQSAGVSLDALAGDAVVRKRCTLLSFLWASTRSQCPRRSDGAGFLFMSSSLDGTHRRGSVFATLGNAPLLPLHDFGFEPADGARAERYWRLPNSQNPSGIADWSPKRSAITHRMTCTPRLLEDCSGPRRLISAPSPAPGRATDAPL